MSTSSAIQVSSQRRSIWERISSFQFLPSPWIVLTLLLACVILLRLPTTLFPKELDPDESQALSNAMKFLVDPRPFIGVDGGSWGPLNSYPIAIFLLMGFKANYVLAHVLATCLVSLQVLTAYLTLRRIGSEKTAALGGVLMVAFYGLATNPNFLNYAGELLPSLLLMAGFYAFVVWLDDNPARSRGVQLLLLFLAGFALGTAPWCKLQSAAMTAAIGLVIAAAIFRGKQRQFDLSGRAFELAAFAAGGLLTTGAMLCTLFALGAQRDFWYSYVLGNAAHAGALHANRSLVHILVMLLMTPVRQLLVVGLCLLLYRAIIGGHLVLSKKQAWALGGILAYTAGALVAVGRVQEPFFHHALLLVPPFSYLAVAITCCNVNKEQDRPSGKVAKGLLAFLVCVVTVSYAFYVVSYVQLVQAVRHFSYSQSESTSRIPRPPFKHGNIDVSFFAHRDSNDRIAAVIRDLQKTYPVRSLEIWGWAPAVYVLIGIPPAARDAVVRPMSGSMDYYFRPRFLGDLRQHPPDLFIDAVVPDVIPQAWSQNDGYETNAAVKDFVDQNYHLVDTLTLIEGAKPVRFFIRKVPGPAL